MKLRHLMLTLLLPSQLAISSGGSLAGRVTSKGEAEALVGVTVLIKGTVRGTTTNTKGEYRILGIAPGDYS
ncbi:MAG TPA: carboxypeptidase-like regulatory domain-containing protein, partial [Bacteroidota bacterium]|nr:carboxypeptidase-like regulatory domain-containing protein [Bacteroidota bacterium]